jgi:hypothetical protein
LPTRDNYTQLTALLLFAAGALLFLSFGYTEMAGSDMWWHVAAGRELLQTKTLWMVDDWSYSALGKDWLNHEWLSDIIFYSWVSVGGVESLVYWKWLVLVATFAILQYVLSRESGSPFAGLLCAGVAMAIAAPFLDVRPHIYSLLNFSLLLFLLLGRQAKTWILAALFVVWVNLHGGFFFGLMALGILVFPWRNFNLDMFRAALVVGIICLLASALNPSGFKAFLYPLKYAFDDSSPFKQLGEWLSPFQRGGIRSPLFFVFMWVPAFALVYLLPRVRKTVAVPWEGIVLTGLTLAMALTSRRFIPLFGMSLAVMMAPLVGLCFRKIQTQKYAVLLALGALLFSAWRMLPYPLKSGPAFHYLTAEYSYPVDMLNFIEASDLRGKVYALYNWGGYIHWRTDGGMKVFIDGRADTIYDADTYNHYVKVLTSSSGWLEKLEATGPDYVLWPQLQKSGQQKLQQLLDSGRWQPVYRDSVSWLLARASLKLPDSMTAAPDTPWRDLTIGQLSAWTGKKDRAIEYGEKTRQAIPWHKGACNLLTSTYRELGKEDKAEAVLQQCRGYFPSHFLH